MNLRTFNRHRWRYRQELRNLFTYGPHAPRSCALIYCRPHDIQQHSAYLEDIMPEDCATIPARYAKTPDILPKKMAEVISGGDWDQQVVPLAEVLPYKLAIEKLTTGMSWDEVGEFARMEAIIAIKGVTDHCRNRSDIEQRYEKMDEMIQVVAKTGKLKSRKEMGRESFREFGGINVALDRDGNWIKLQGGTHRLAIATHFDIPAIPVCLRIVHTDFVTSGGYRALYKRSNTLNKL